MSNLTHAVSSLASATIIGGCLLGSAYMNTHPDARFPSISDLFPTSSGSPSSAKTTVFAYPSTVKSPNAFVKSVKSVLTKRAGAIIMGVIVAAGLGFGAFTFYKKRKESKKDADASAGNGGSSYRYR
ncbi:hypothetical protein DFS34DRAFT_131375 [Phlyctochytrium arcticum]|nr:hypothetical protein DFS34DRAFT_131375 [Phlyctochytrium arcticum]